VGNTVEVNDDFFDRLAKAVAPPAPAGDAPTAANANTHEHKIEGVVKQDDFETFKKSIDEKLTPLGKLLAIFDPGDREAGREPGALIKMISDVRDTQGTHHEVLEKLLDRVEKLESRGVTRKSAAAPDADGGNREEALTKARGGDLDDLFRYIARNHGTALTLTGDRE